MRPSSDDPDMGFAILYYVVAAIFLVGLIQNIIH